MIAWLHKWMSWLLFGATTRKAQPVTISLSLTPAETALENTVSTIATGMTSLGGEAEAFWTALVAAAKAKWGDIPIDAVALDDLVILGAQLATDVGVPGAPAVLLVSKLISAAVPEAANVLQFIGAVSGVLGIKLGAAGANPAASPQDGGYPSAPGGGNRGPA